VLLSVEAEPAIHIALFRHTCGGTITLVPIAPNIILLLLFDGSPKGNGATIQSVFDLP
jgi:hypothetical protein